MLGDIPTLGFILLGLACMPFCKSFCLSVIPFFSEQMKGFSGVNSRSLSNEGNLITHHDSYEQLSKEGGRQLLNPKLCQTLKSL